MSALEAAGRPEAPVPIARKLYSWRDPTVNLVATTLSEEPENSPSPGTPADDLLAQGWDEDPKAALLDVLQSEPGNLEAFCQLGQIYRAEGQLALAQDAFRKALASNPSFGSAHLGLGQAYYDLGRSAEALQHLEQALKADPNNADALCYCGLAIADTGQLELALQFLRRAIQTEPNNMRYIGAAIDVLGGIEFKAENAWYEKFLIDCLDSPALPHDALTNVAMSLVWIKPAMRAALAADRLESSHLTALAQEPLLLRLLSRTIGRNWAFESFFVDLRRTLARACDTAHLPLMAAVAEQAFNAGYVQYQSDPEAAIEQELLARVPASLEPVELMVLASYRPLIDIPGAEALTSRTDWPEVVERVLERTLHEPIRERGVRSQIEVLTPINDAISRRVQAQYEEHPYPRWIATQAVDDVPRRLVDEITRHAMNFRDPGWPDQPKALVPGCGTGYHPLVLARRHPETDVLAVDLSLTSLAYAIRKQQELNIPNVRFCQADLLGLGTLDERFDYIDCAGVLHHLESPMDGWRVLSGLLKPGGVMRIGLYSELARKPVVKAREKIAALGVGSTPTEIRNFRQAIMNDPELAELRTLASTTADFYSMGGIRDLIFHEQEHRFDLPTIKQHLETLGLEFGGFLLHDRDVVREFHSKHPTSQEWLDLDCWARFEAEHPNTFYRMYQFYCLKSANELR
jgi:tetratricopeptide (TPR) repeat protein/SAM-dependent methyltransferase